MARRTVFEDDGRNMFVECDPSGDRRLVLKPSRIANQRLAYRLVYSRGRSAPTLDEQH